MNFADYLKENAYDSLYKELERDFDSALEFEVSRSRTKYRFPTDEQIEMAKRNVIVGVNSHLNNIIMRYKKFNF